MGMVLLSFDTEEFDLPREQGLDYDSVGQGVEVSRYGINRILDILEKHEVKATFFCTTNFAVNAPAEMQRIKSGGHEIAAHGCDHFSPKPEDTLRCKMTLEELVDVKVKGWRQPRMFPVDIDRLKSEGYEYNASLNPAFIPGRYMHLNMPRTSFMEKGVLQIPASVTPWFRIPMFWLSLHNFPLVIYKWLLRRILKHDGYFNTYFHPWEFYPLGEHPEFKTPFIIKRNAGDAMCRRLDSVIADLKARGAVFDTYSKFTERLNNNKI